MGDVIDLAKYRKPQEEDDGEEAEGLRIIVGADVENDIVLIAITDNENMADGESVIIGLDAERASAFAESLLDSVKKLAN